MVDVSEHPTFRSQHPVGPYIVEFYCSALKLAIEVDGRIHELGGNPTTTFADRFG